MSQQTFEITHRGPADLLGRIYELADPDVPVKRGRAVGAHSSDPTKVIDAAPGNFIGFLSRDVTKDGATLASLHGLPDSNGGDFDPLETPIKSGDYSTVEHADIFEAEGDDFVIDSGTGALSASTTVGTLLEFFGGKLRERQGTNKPEFVVDGILTGANLVDSTNAFRVIARRYYH